MRSPTLRKAFGVVLVSVGLAHLAARGLQKLDARRYPTWDQDLRVTVVPIPESRSFAELDAIFASIAQGMRVHQQGGRHYPRPTGDR